jgi:hypothetical protein
MGQDRGAVGLRGSELQSKPQTLNPKLLGFRGLGDVGNGSGPLGFRVSES